MPTETKEKYFCLKGYNIRMIWEPDFKLQEKSDVKLIRQHHPPFYRKHGWMQGIHHSQCCAGRYLFFFFGNWYSWAGWSLLRRDATPFCNSEVKFEDMGAFMQQYVRDHGLLGKPCCFLLSGMRAEKILLSSPYLKWLLQKRLIVTKLHQVIEYTPQCCFRKFMQEVSDTCCAGDIDNAQKIITDTMKPIGNSGHGSPIMDKRNIKTLCTWKGREQPNWISMIRDSRNAPWSQTASMKWKWPRPRFASISPFNSVTISFGDGWWWW